MQEIIVTANEAGQRFDKLLSKYLNEAPKSFIYKMLRKKNIVLNGKKATCYTGFETQLMGAQISEEPVCTDGNIITSRGAGTALEFSFELVSKLISPERVKPLRETIIFPR